MNNIIILCIISIVLLFPSSALNSAYISIIMAIYELLSPSFSDPWTILSLSIAPALYHVTAPGLSSPSHKMSSLHIYHIGWRRCGWMDYDGDEYAINQSIIIIIITIIIIIVCFFFITTIIFIIIIIIIKSSFSSSYRKWSSKKNSSTRW